MFTGIVQARQKITDVKNLPGLRRITIDFTNKLRKNLKHGASVSIDGTCLTVVDMNGSNVLFEIMQETLNKTTLAILKKGQEVNIERSAKTSDEVGGHRVAGHVHGIAEIIKVGDSLNNRVLTVLIPSEWMKYIFTKGFIALDGVSLTVGDIDRKKNIITINLIPETRRLTTFGFKGKGDYLNLEIDPQTQAIVETVERVLQESKSKL